MELKNIDEIIKVYIGLINSGMNKNTSQVLNFCLVPVLNNKELPALYIENNDIDYNRLNKEYRDIFNHQLLSNVEQTIIKSKGIEDIESIIFFKDNIKEIKKEVISYLKEISEDGKYNIKFYTNNSNDWIDFISIAFDYKDELPIFPNNVSIYNMDAMSILTYKIYDDNLVNSIINLSIGTNNNSILEAKKTKTIFESTIFNL